MGARQSRGGRGRGDRQVRVECDKRTGSVPSRSSYVRLANGVCQNPSSLRIGSYLSKQPDAQEAPPERLVSGLEPTQRLSDVSITTSTRTRTLLN